MGVRQAKERSQQGTPGVGVTTRPPLPSRPGGPIGWAQSLGRRVSVARELGPFIGMVIAVLIFQFGSGGAFLSPIEVTNILTIAAALAIIGAGVTMLIISGEFDLSVGTVFAIVPVWWGILIVNNGYNPQLAFVMAMGLAAGIGLVNGFLTIVFKIPSFIVTLGTFYALQGLVIVMTGGFEIVLPDMPITNVLGANVGGTFLTMETVWTVAIVAIAWFVLEQTRFGNWIFAAGSSRGVARAMGVPERRVKFVLFALCSVLAGFAGCCVAARLLTVGSTFGTDYNLLAIVATVVGGTSLFGGRGTMVGTLIGAILVSSIQPGLIELGAGGTWYQAVVGVVLVIAVLFNIRFEVFRSKRVGMRN